jgi:NAD(P)-dependent dehydrogenase (short-subunit alcohol dehydrogenase family)
MGKYDRKSVVITGGSSGVGLATAKLLVFEGARVLITGRTQATLDSAGEQLGNNAVAVQSDAASLPDIEALAERVKAEFGSLDTLFVDAGITRFVPFEQMTEQVYDELLAVNAKGAYFTVQKLAPLLSAGGGVVLTTSVANVLGIPMVSAYAASKAALRSTTRSLARELLPRGIRVNAVSPGPMDTGILDRSMPKEAAEQTKSQMTAENPMQRFGDQGEVAKAVVFLAFDATYTTGAELPVDGGGSQL